MRPPSLAIGILVAFAALACDRAIEPYVPGEKPEQPDLSRIFPEGAERATKDAPMGGPPGSVPSAMASGRGAPPVAGAEAPALAGTVTLAPDYARKVPAGAILFVIARPAQAGGPPLAVKRVESPSFPLAFTLGPSDRMIEAMPFAGPLQLSARIDTDGNAMTRTPGDLQGQADALHQPGDQGIEIAIDEML